MYDSWTSTSKMSWSFAFCSRSLIRVLTIRSVSSRSWGKRAICSPIMNSHYINLRLTYLLTYTATSQHWFMLSNLWQISNYVSSGEWLICAFIVLSLFCVFCLYYVYDCMFLIQYSFFHLASSVLSQLDIIILLNQLCLSWTDFSVTARLTGSWFVIDMLYTQYFIFPFIFILYFGYNFIINK